MKTGHIGNISELTALTYLLKLDREVAIPYGNTPGYDLLVVGKDGLWKKIQVKTAYKRSLRSQKIYCDFLRGSGKGNRRFYQVGDFDFLIAVLQDPICLWVFNINEVVGKRCRTVGLLDPEYMYFSQI